MAIVSLSQIGPGRQGEAKADYNRSYTVPFQIIVNNPYDGIGVVANGVDPNTGLILPGRYVPYVGFESGGYVDLFALCTNLKVQQDGNEWMKWKAEALFETNFQIQQQQQPQDDPVIPWMEIERERRAVTKTWDGKSIRNSAGQLLQGIARNFINTAYCFLQNELALNPQIQTYNDATNSDTFLGAPPGTLLCEITPDKQQRRNEYVFWPHTYKFKYKAAGWNEDYEDRGTMAIGSDGYLKNVQEIASNRPMNGEVSLNGQGFVIQNASDSNIVYLSSNTFKSGQWNGKPPEVYQPMPFGNINLALPSSAPS